MRCHITVYLCIGLSPQWKWKLTTWAQTFSSCIFVNWYSRDASIIWCLFFFLLPLQNSSYFMTSNFKIILNIHKYFATAYSEGNLAHIVSKQTSSMWTLKNCLCQENFQETTFHYQLQAFALLQTCRLDIFDQNGSKMCSLKRKCASKVADISSIWRKILEFCLPYSWVVVFFALTFQKKSKWQACTSTWMLPCYWNIFTCDDDAHNKRVGTLLKSISTHCTTFPTLSFPLTLDSGFRKTFLIFPL